jgi:hypothetical protein
MAATGTLAAARDAIVTQLTALGLKAVTDPRNARPLSCMVELPTAETFTYNVLNISVRVRILGAPPANQDAGDYLITTADQIINSALSVTSANPGAANYGGQDLPTYDLTIAVAVRRN